MVSWIRPPVAQTGTDALSTAGTGATSTGSDCTRTVPLFYNRGRERDHSYRTLSGWPTFIPQNRAIPCLNLLSTAFLSALAKALVIDEWLTHRTLVSVRFGANLGSIQTDPVVGMEHILKTNDEKTHLTVSGVQKTTGCVQGELYIWTIDNQFTQTRGWGR